ncbi:MAG TPA: HAD family phosphatase [archaeon]|nr:HAD family phosphatase [archaeon]
MTRIKAVIFDWGGVLIEDPDLPRAEFVAARLGVAPESFLRELGGYEKEFQKGLITEKELLARIAAALGIVLPQFNGSLLKEAVRSTFRRREPVFELARELKRRGFLVALLSNCEEPTAEFASESRWFDFFDLLVFSNHEHVAKPDAEIFNRALERLKVSSSEAVFVDDKKIHVEAARSIGFHAVLFTGVDALAAELKELGVL